jgi:hypothetical protein
MGNMDMGSDMASRSYLFGLTTSCPPTVSSSPFFPYQHFASGSPFTNEEDRKQATQVTATVEAQLLIPNVMCTDTKKKLGKSKHVTYKSRAQTEREKERERELLIQAVTTQSSQDDYSVDIFFVFFWEGGRGLISLSAH